MFLFSSLLIICLDLFIIAFAAYFIWYIWWRNFGQSADLHPPFISVDSRAVEDIVSALDLQDDDILYDLGCGSAGVLIASAGSNTKIKAVGVEINPWVIWLARFKIWRRRLRDQIIITSGDFYNYPISDANKVFLFLFPKAMDQLLPHLEAELKPGTLVVSAAFFFTHKEPIRILELDAGKRQIARRLYIYQF